jgi:quercetin dioxygenase-like cupin family protein
MKIFDNENNLLGYLIKIDDFPDDKKFLTENNSEFQVATFTMEENEIIKRHIHNKYKRKVFTTSEAITVIEGTLEVEIYDLNKSYLNTFNLNAGDTIVMIAGGHGLKATKNTKFIEIKQGPYDQEKDKFSF